MMDDYNSREKRRGQMKEKMSGMKDKLKWVLIITTILLVIYGVWFSYDRFFSYAGVANSITIEVQNIEVSERYGEHTVIWAKHALGDRTFKYTFIGRYDFEPGNTYRIEYINRVKILFISVRLELWGEVTSIEQIR